MQYLSLEIIKVDCKRGEKSKTWKKILKVEEK